MCFSVLISKPGLRSQDSIKISTHSPCLPFILCSLHQIGLHVMGALGSCREEVTRCRLWNFALLMPTTYSCIPMYVECTGSQNVYTLALHQHTWSFNALQHGALQTSHSSEMAFNVVLYITLRETRGRETESLAQRNRDYKPQMYHLRLTILLLISRQEISITSKWLY